MGILRAIAVIAVFAAPALAAAEPAPGYDLRLGWSIGRLPSSPTGHGIGMSLDGGYGWGRFRTAAHLEMLAGTASGERPTDLFIYRLGVTGAYAIVDRRPGRQVVWLEAGTGVQWIALGSTSALRSDVTAGIGMRRAGLIERNGRTVGGFALMRGTFSQSGSGVDAGVLFTGGVTWGSR